MKTRKMLVTSMLIGLFAVAGCGVGNTVNNAVNSAAGYAGGVVNGIRGNNNGGVGNGSGMYHPNNRNNMGRGNLNSRGQAHNDGALMHHHAGAHPDHSSPMRHRT